MPATATMEERLANLRSQIDACEQGLQASLMCPFCQTENKPDSAYLCCEMMARSVNAILDRKTIEAAQEFIEQIGSEVARHEARSTRLLCRGADYGERIDKEPVLMDSHGQWIN